MTAKVARYTKALAWVTGVFAFVTGVLVVVGFFQAWDTKQATREVRAATKIARRNLELLPEIERAYVSGGGGRQLVSELHQDLLYPIEPTWAISYRQDGAIVTRPTGKFEVHANNHGKTPAIVHHFPVWCP